MTSPYLAGAIADAEGLRLRAYPDPLSGGAPWTIGYGHTGKDVHEGLVWTLEQANAALKADIADAEAVLDRAIPWWRQLSDYRQDVLAELSFSLGWHVFSQFHQFLTLVDQARYVEAATDLLATKAARELPRRYGRLATQLRTGVRAV